MNITTNLQTPQYCQTGDTIAFEQRDPNKWRRFWRFITFRSPPKIREVYTVNKVTGTTVTFIEVYSKGTKKRS